MFWAPLNSYKKKYILSNNNNININTNDPMIVGCGTNLCNEEFCAFYNLFCFNNFAFVSLRDKVFIHLFF